MKKLLTLFLSLSCMAFSEVIPNVSDDPSIIIGDFAKKSYVDLFLSTNGITQASADTRYLSKTNADVMLKSVFACLTDQAAISSTNPVDAARYAGYANDANSALYADAASYADHLLEDGTSYYGADLVTATTVASNLAQSAYTLASSLANNGTFLYNSSATNSVNTGCYELQSVVPANFVRSYTGLTNGAYCGYTMTTQRYVSVSGPITVNSYLSRVATGGNPSLSVHAEIYYSYDGTNNWFGDYDTQSQTINAGTNLYQFIVSVPQFVATNTTGVYIRRALKVDSVNNASLNVNGGTGTPSSVSFTVGSGSGAQTITYKTIAPGGGITTNSITDGIITDDDSGLMPATGSKTNIILGLTNTADSVTMKYTGGVLTFTEVYNGVTNTYNALNN